MTRHPLRLARYLAALLLPLALASCPPDDTSDPAFPCQYGAGSYGSGAAVLAPASSYAWSVIVTAASLGGVSPPAGGAYQAAGTLAMYDPNGDAIYYSPTFLNQLYFSFGALEPGDSVLFHETGHMWAKKTGRMTCIGSATTPQLWNQEFQADSYAGAVLSALGGSPVPSLQVYNTVLAAWSATHPPGGQRAQVFLDGYQFGVEDYCPSSSSLGSGDTLADLALLAELRSAGRRLDREGLDPYRTESDGRFQELLSAQAWERLQTLSAPLSARTPAGRTATRGRAPW